VRIQAELGLVDEHEDYMNRRFGDPDSPDMIAARNALNEFVDIAQEAQVEVGIAVFPAAVLVDSVADFPYGYLLDRALEVCAEEGIGCVDLRHAYLGISETEGFWASELDHHPGRRANEVAAEAVAAYFGDEWLAAAEPGDAGTREPVR
jgi:hypothetical protein